MGIWSFEDARRRLEELLQRALDEGPQRVHVGRHARVVVLSLEDYQRLAAGRGEAEPGPEDPPALPPER